MPICRIQTTSNRIAAFYNVLLGIIQFYHFHKIHTKKLDTTNSVLEPKMKLVDQNCALCV